MSNKATLRELKIAVLTLCVMITLSFLFVWGLCAALAYTFGYTLSFLQAVGIWVAWVIIKIQLKNYRRG